MTLIIPPEAAGKRVDIFLAESIDEILTRSAAQRLIDDGNIEINNKPLKKNYRLENGDILTYQIPAPIPQAAEAEDIPINIVYEDNDLLVINKPQGMVVHPGSGNYTGTLVNALLFHCGTSLSGIGGVLRPGIVHRLDKDTSGLMVAAKNDKTHQSLASQLSNRTMGREYTALCTGIIKVEKQKIDLPIGRHPHDRKKMAIITNNATKSRNAVTYVEVKERINRYTLISAKLETGRTHQIRVHLAHIGHPVVGDLTYGTVNPKGLNLKGQLLHATKIKFLHPSTGEEKVFESPPPDYFIDAVNQLT